MQVVVLSLWEADAHQCAESVQEPPAQAESLDFPLLPLFLWLLC